MRAVLLAALIAAGGAPSPLRAQAPDTVEKAAPTRVGIAGPVPIPIELLPEWNGVPGAPAPGADTLACPECDPPRRFWLGVGDLMVSQFVPFLVSNYITREEWARVSPQTWANNLSYPWQWDDNDFQNNQFGHSYQGNLYYNAARTNGYNFWASSLWPVAGSLMWEYFFEAWAPAPNDFVNTAVGGVVLGESLYRISRLTLDNTATGKERTFREIGNALLNPVSALNRLVLGETGRVSENPPEWRPTFLLGVLDLGYRRTTQSIGSGVIEEGTNQWNATMLLSYGDPVKDLSGKPFSYFAIRADLAGPGDALVNQLSVRGSLASWPLGRSQRHQIAASLEYDYLNNPAFEYGGQSAQIGLVSAIGAPGKTWWGQTLVLFNGVLLGAVQSDQYSALEGRNYDYGPGLGMFVGGRVLYKNKLQATAGYTRLWLYTVDGAQSTHFQSALLVEARYWASRKVGVGVSFTGYSRHSEYADQTEAFKDASFVRFFLSRAMPGLPLP